MSLPQAPAPAAATVPAVCRTAAAWGARLPVRVWCASNPGDHAGALATVAKARSSPQQARDCPFELRTPVWPDTMTPVQGRTQRTGHTHQAQVGVEHCREGSAAAGRPRQVAPRAVQEGWQRQRAPCSGDEARAVRRVPLRCACDWYVVYMSGQDVTRS